MVFTFSSVWCGRKFWLTKNLWPGLQKTMGFGRKMFCTLTSGVHSLQFLALNFLFYSKHFLNYFFLPFLNIFVEEQLNITYHVRISLLFLYFMLHPNCLPTWVGSLLKFIFLLILFSNFWGSVCVEGWILWAINCIGSFCIWINFLAL